MNSPEQSLFPRIVMGMVVVACLLLVAGIFAFNMNRGRVALSDSVDLRGAWGFCNGSHCSRAEDFSLKVNVPEPLSPQLSAPLADEFWYRTTFSLPKVLDEGTEPIKVFLGTVKGEHEVYWNGDRIGAGGKLTLGLYDVPRSYTREGPIELRVRVRKPDHLFPGITHMLPVAVGPANQFEELREFYMFDTGVKPLLLAAFKLCLFLAFGVLCILVPRKREYISFSFFVLFSAAVAASYSRYLPIYFDFYLRNCATFIFATLSFCVIPWLTGDIVRAPGPQRMLWRGYGLFLACSFFCALFWIEGRDRLISLYQVSGRWLPVAVGIPSVIALAKAYVELPAALGHRRKQVLVFSTLLFAGTWVWWASAGNIFSFSYIPYPELWDAGLFAGLALSTIMDVRSSVRRSERAGKVVPKWFSAFLATGTHEVILDLPMIALAVDTVSYTKILSGLSEAEKGVLHENIRAHLAPLVERFGAQKLSDRGDGALFGWDFSGEREFKINQARLVAAAAKSLLTNSNGTGGIQFRVGIAAGTVRGELRGSETSFLGEPLNAASRLETMARPGTALFHETVVDYLPSASFEEEWAQSEIKGVNYRAKQLASAA